MSIFLERGIGWKGRESRFNVPGLEGELVEVHPWSREGDESVYLAVFGSDGVLERNVILDRADFVRGLAAVFPELSNGG